MTGHTFLLRALLPLFALAPTQASAEESASETESILATPEPSQGHYLSFGLYYVGTTVDDRNRGRRGPGSGLGFSIGLGESVTDWLDLGVELANATPIASKEEESINILRFNVRSQLRFTQRSYLIVGLGAQRADGPDPEDEGKERGRYGDIYLLGLGTNLFLSEPDQSGGWTLTPTINLEFGPDKDFDTYALWAGLEIRWWTGFSRDKLDLPIDEAYQGE